MAQDYFGFEAEQYEMPFPSPGRVYGEHFEDYPEYEAEDNEFLFHQMVHQRISILIAALVVIMPLMVFLLSRLSTGNDVVSRPVTPDITAGNVALPTPVSAPGTGGGLQSYTGQISPVFTNEVKYWEANIVSWSAQYDLDPNLTAIIMQVESCGDPNAVSSAGAQGLFQVMPFHFTSGENMQDPDTNARRGLNYFTEGLRLTGGNAGLSYAGYNGGHGTAAKSQNQWPNETQRYYTWTTGIHEDIQAGLTESPTLQAWLQAGGSALCRQAANRLGISG